LKAKKQGSLEKVLAGINIRTQKRTKRDLLDWIAHHNIQLREGLPFSFDGHEYLREIYEIEAPEKCFRKGAQVGISTWSVLESLWLADQLVCKGIYFFPNDGDVEDFSVDRMDPIIQGTPYLMDRVQEEKGGAFNRGLKMVGESSLFMRGMFTRTKVKSVDADFLVFDELDEAKPAMLEFARDRILHSSLGWVRELSQPTFINYGIDAAFEESDMRFWLLRCPACGEWNNLDENWPKNFMRVSQKETERTGQLYYRGCLKCNAPLDMSTGEWVAKHPGRGKLGYQLSQLYTQILPQGCVDPADRIMGEYHRARKPYQRERFANSRRGKAYAGDKQPITETVLDACEADYRWGLEAGIATGIGIDQGDTMHVVVIGLSPINKKKRVLWAEAVDEWEKVAEIIRTFNAVFAVDALPNKHDAKNLVRAFPGRGFIQYFMFTEKRKTEGEDEKEVAVINVERTETLDTTTDLFKKQDIEIPAMKNLDGEALANLDDFRTQLKTLIKDIKVKENGQKVAVYKTDVENHYGMALNSALIAMALGPFIAWAPENYQSAGPRITKSQLDKVYGG